MTIYSVLRRFVPPYKWLVALNMFFNVLSTIFSLFSFATLIPVLQLLFGLTVAEVEPMSLANAQGVQEMLDVLKNKALRETAVAVVRYFGGIKLGAGGLVRAYSSAVAENLAAATICSLQMCTEWTIRVDYTGIDSVQKYLSSHTCSLLSTNYGEKVEFVVAVKNVDCQPFIDGLIDFLQGRVETQRGREYYGAFQP